MYTAIVRQYMSVQNEIATASAGPCEEKTCLLFAKANDFLVWCMNISDNSRPLFTLVYFQATAY